MSCAHSFAQTAPVLRPVGVPAKPASAAVDVKSGTDSAQEHLKVWGKWKIVVKNPDGTVASTTEFENSLFDKGLTAEQLLAGYIVPNSWSVGLFNGPSGDGPGPCGSGFVGLCYIVPSTTSTAGTQICSIFGRDSSVYGTCVGGGLTTSIVGSAFQLTGGFTATYTGTIGGVTTVALYCSTDPNSNNTPAIATTTSPSGCAAGGYTYYRKFTQALPSSTPAFTPISVTSGQIIQVTVALSFS
jgi:hypothetical protein